VSDLGGVRFAIRERRLIGVGEWQHADSPAPRGAHGVGKTADTLREDRNG